MSKIVKVTSYSDPSIIYDVNVTEKTCTCPAYTKRKYKVPCKHLISLGVTKEEEFKGDSVTDLEKLGEVSSAELYTIGHSNYPIEKFVGMLQEHGIKTLVDVRSKPYSRYSPQFSRPDLFLALKEVGVGYLWGGKFLGGLGTTSVESLGFVVKMNRVLELSTKSPTAMMCSERNPAGCHRGMKLTAWVHRTHAEVTPMHITPEGLIDSLLFEKSQPEKWLWHEFGGEYGAPNKK